MTKAGSTVRFNTDTNTSKPAVSFSNPNFGDSTKIDPDTMAKNYQDFDQTDTSPIIPEIRIRSLSFRVREVILAAVCLVTFITCIVLMAVLGSYSGSSDSNPTGTANAQLALQTICTSPPCLKSAAYAVGNMNTTIKPCNDFYEYACGNFANLNPLNPDVGRRSVFYNLYDENKQKLRTILEQSSSRDASFSSERKLKDFFASCTDDYGRMRAGGKVFIDKIINPLGGWDVLNTLQSNYSFQAGLEKASIDFAVPIFFDFRIATDQYNQQNRIIEIGYPWSHTRMWFFYSPRSSEQIRTDYKKFMRTVAQLLAKHSGLNLDKNQLDSRIETFVNDAYDIEAQLANLTRNRQRTEDPHHPDNKVSLNDLTTSTDNVVDFVHFFQAIFGSENVNSNTKIANREDQFVRQALAMIKNLPADTKNRKLSNHMIWTLAAQYTEQLSWEYMYAGRTFWKDVYGVENFWGTWKICFYYIKWKMFDALGSLFARMHFKDNNKGRAQEIVNYVRQMLLSRIDQIKYMDDDTKAKARAKVKASTDKIGYPDFYMDESAIDAIYENFDVNRTDYFQNILNLNVFRKRDMTRRLLKTETRDRWQFAVYWTFMYYSNRWNQLLIPAGMLQFPIYEWTLPHYYNFGGMGGLVGSHLVNTINRRGSYTDADGKFGNWYSSSTNTNYNNLIQCYADVYNNQTIGPITAKGQRRAITVPVQGRWHAPKALAITSGIRIAYNAYKNWLQDKGTEKLGPTPHYTNDQSFFLTFAQLMCQTQTDQRNYYDAMRGRVPGKTTVNVAFSMLEEFTTTFGCPANSKMNSKKKCDTF